MAQQKLFHYCLLLPLAWTLLSVGCNQRNAYVPPPAPPVEVAKPTQGIVVNYSYFTGRTKSVASVDVRARVKGFLEKVHFEPSDYVKAGDLLFEIEPDLYKARLEQAEANLEARKDTERASLIEYKRLQQAFARQAVSESDLVKGNANWLIAKADVKLAEASLAEAKVNYRYTKIYAPISGKIGRSLIDEGNLVGEGDATLLTTIVAFDPIYAYFSASEREVIKYLERRQKVMSEVGARTVPLLANPLGIGPLLTINLNAASIGTSEVEMGLSGDDGYPFPGFIDFADNTIDPNTGTLLIRGIFSNPGAEQQLPQILPGVFAKIRMPQAKSNDAILVPEAAVSFDQTGPYLLVVEKSYDEEKKREVSLVGRKNVKLGTRVPPNIEITEGISMNDLVIVSGLQRAIVDSEVTVLPRKDDN